jgi:hypothetical protein
MRRGAITQQDQEFVETWENISVTSNVVIRLDVRGEEKPEVVTGQRNFMITTEERMITQNKIREKANDPFRNGCFRPVTVPDGVTVESNPNALSNEEVRQALYSSDFVWSEWMKTIDSPETLRRMIEMATERGSKVTYDRIQELRESLENVKPATQVTQKDREQYEAIGAGVPVGAGTPPSGSTGRSSRYR